MKERQISPDILIIGGGVIGLTIARELHKRGASRIAVVDKGRCGEEASWAAAGMLGPQAEANDAGPFFDLCVESRDLYPTFAAELRDETSIDVELDRTGTLHLAFSDDDAAHLRSRFEWQTAASLPVERLSARDLRSLEPTISEHVLEALLFPNDWQVENRKLLGALRRYAENNGIEILENTKVEGLVVEAGSVIGAETQRGRIAAGTTVVATGAWTSLIQLGTMSLPVKVEPVRGQMIAFNTGERPFSHVIYSSRGYVVPRLDGRILAGSTSEQVGFDASTTGETRVYLEDMAAQIVPRLGELGIVDQWAGLRPFAPDGFPVLGSIENVDGLFIATAHYRNGILLAPITAKLAADTVAGGVRSEYVRIFAPGRFQPRGVGINNR